MSKSYLDEDSCVVCSFMTSSSPNTVVTVDSGLNVFHATPNKHLLRHVDVKVKKDFVCKKPFSSMLGFAGFLIGFGAGFAALGGAAAMAALMGPVGWAALAIAIVAIALIAAFAKANNLCNSALSGQLWQLPNKTVNFKGKFAIHQASFLKCSQDGIITAIPDKAMAAQAASSISKRSIGSIGLKTLSQAVYGFAAGAFSSKTGGLSTSSMGASVLNRGALTSALAFSGIGYYVGEITDTHGGAATGTGLAATVQPYVDDFASGATTATLGSRFNAWWAFKPALSEMPVISFFKGMTLRGLPLRSAMWARSDFGKGIGIGIATYLSDVIIVDPLNKAIENSSADIGKNAAADSSGIGINTLKF